MRYEREDVEEAEVTPSEEHLAGESRKGATPEKRPDRKSPALQWAFVVRGELINPLVLRNTCVQMEMGQSAAINGISAG